MRSIVPLIALLGVSGQCVAQSDWTLLDGAAPELEFPVDEAAASQTPIGEAPIDAVPIDESPTRKAPASETPTPVSQELTRVQNLMRAEVFELAQEILETQQPTPQLSAEWWQWERQLWALYRRQNQWQKLYQRVQRLPPATPQAMQHQATLQVVEAMTASQQGSSARSLLRAQLLRADVTEQRYRDFRQAMVAAYVADGLLPDARIAVDGFYREYSSQETAWLLLSAGVLLQSGNPAAAINLLAPLQNIDAQLLRLYARLNNQTMPPAQVIARAMEIMASPRGESMAREIQAMIVQAHIHAQQPQAVVTAMEEYLLMSAHQEAPTSRVYPQFSMQNLVDEYAAIARQQAEQVDLLVGDEARWLAHAKQLPSESAVARKAMFAYLALNADSPPLRQRATDAYVNILLDENQIGLIERLFAHPSRHGKLTLSGETGVRLSAHAMTQNNVQLAADANASLLQLPATAERKDWLLQAARIDIFAGRYQSGADKLHAWLEIFTSLNAAQSSAVLQPVFDLQTAEQHQLALPLLHKIERRAATDKQRREIAYWLAESYDGNGQYRIAAELFLRSALQTAAGFDRWGQAARFRAAEVLMHNNLFGDAQRLFEGLFAHASEKNRRNRLQQKLQQVRLLQSSQRGKISEGAEKNEQ